jgi:hypothetical protein
MELPVPARLGGHSPAVRRRRLRLVLRRPERRHGHPSGLDRARSVPRIFGPAAQYDQNSKSYSAVCPGPNSAIRANPPHVKVEILVYR